MGNINEKIVLVGGGGGVYQVALFLKLIRRIIVTIQTMFDHGGHSGQLRDARGGLPTGDISRAILALADEKIAPVLRVLLTHRFEKKGDTKLDGATMRNLMFAALTESGISLPEAIDQLCKLYQVQGTVLPVSLCDADLCVRLSDGEVLKGEGLIDTRSHKDARSITECFLEPPAMLYTRAYQELVTADKIVLCPGDLVTSLVPNLLVDGFKDALAKSKAQLIFVTNIMTKAAETRGFTAADFAKFVLPYTGREKFDVMICNNGPIPQEILDRYAEEDSRPVSVNVEFYPYTHKACLDSVAEFDGGIVRHGAKLARIIASL